MDKFLLEKIHAATPKFNDKLANGLATEHMREAVAYIDRLLRAAQADFPEGLIYVGNQICTPQQHFKMITREYNAKRQANIARSDTYLVKYMFKFFDEELEPCFVQIPFVRDGGLVTINGAVHNIAPVISDIGFSVVNNGIFVQLNKTKLNFYRADYHYYENGTHRIHDFIWSRIHHGMAKLKKSDCNNRKIIETSLPHYFFARFGVVESFHRWAHAEVMIGQLQDFTEKSHPRDKFAIFHSDSLRGHPTSQVCLVVPRDQVNTIVHMFVSAFFYVADTLPDMFHHSAENGGASLWRLMLGHLIEGDYKSRGQLDEDMETHLNSVDGYLDEITREEFLDLGVDLKGIYELFYYVMDELNDRFRTGNQHKSSLYGKRLKILRYVLREFNASISRFGFSFQTHRNKKWTVDDLNKLLRKHFRLNTCIRDFSRHGEINTVSYPGDNKIFRITRMLIPQDKASQSVGYSKGSIGDSSKLLHASLADVCSFNNQPKNNPTGHGSLNITLDVDVNGTVRPNPVHQKLLNDTQRRLKR